MIRFDVPAVPVAQPRPRTMVVKGEPIVRTADSKHPINTFKAVVAHAAREAYDGAPLDVRLRLSLVFVMPRPGRLMWKTKPMPRQWYEGSKDRDNLQKGFKDALNGVLWRDDRQIVSGPCDVVYAAGGEQPHVEVQIEALDGLPEQPARDMPCERAADGTR